MNSIGLLITFIGFIFSLLAKNAAQTAVLSIQKLNAAVDLSKIVEEMHKLRSSILTSDGQQCEAISFNVRIEFVRLSTSKRLFRNKRQKEELNNVIAYLASLQNNSLMSMANIDSTSFNENFDTVIKIAERIKSEASGG